jgi:hypothetical protein
MPALQVHCGYCTTPAAGKSRTLPFLSKQHDRTHGYLCVIIVPHLFGSLQEIKQKTPGLSQRPVLFGLRFQPLTAGVGQGGHSPLDIGNIKQKSRAMLAFHH